MKKTISIIKAIIANLILAIAALLGTIYVFAVGIKIFFRVVVAEWKRDKTSEFEGQARNITNIPLIK